MTTDAPIVEPPLGEDKKFTPPWANWFRQVTRNLIDLVVETITINSLTADRLVSSDSNKKLVSVADFTNWISGTASEIEVTDNGDGTVTIGLPNDVIVTDSLEVQNRDVLRYAMLQG